MVENIFKTPHYIDIYTKEIKLVNNYLFIDDTITLLNNDTDKNKYYHFRSYNFRENYSYIFKENTVIVYDLRENELFNISKKIFLKIFN